MARKQFPLSVVIEAVDKLTAPMRRINQQINDTFAPVRKLGLGLKALGQESGLVRLGQGVGQLGRSLQNAGDQATRLGFKLAAAGAGAAWLFKRQFIDTADAFERLEFSLRAIEGSAEKAAKSMEFLKRMTVETPYELEEVTSAYRLMRGFGLDPMNGSLKSVIDQTAKLGLKGDALTSIVLQLGQAFGKAKLQAQDIRVMAERGIPVWDLLARAAERAGKKVSVAQLQMMSEKGQLGRSAVLKLIEQMGIESQGASELMMKSWSGMVSNLSDQWTFFKMEVMKSGPFDWLKGKLQGILDTIDQMGKSGELQAWAERVGGNIVHVLEQLWSFGKDAWEVIRGVASSLKWLHDLFGSWKPLIIGVGLILAGPFLVSLLAVGGAVVGLVMALGSIAPLVLGVGVVVAGLVMAFNNVVDVLARVGKAIDDYLVKPLGGAAGWLLDKLGGFFGSGGGARLLGAPVAFGDAAGARGAPAGAGGIPITQNITRTNDAAVRVSFDNVPQGVRVRQVSGTAPLTLDMGRMMAG